MANLAAINPYCRVLKHKWTPVVRMATQARLLIAQPLIHQLGLRAHPPRGCERTMRVVTIRALNHALIHAMLHGHGKLRPYIGVARIAKLGLLLGQQKPRRCGFMDGVAVGAHHIRFRMLRPLYIRSRYGICMARQAVFQDLLFGHHGKSPDRRLLAHAFHMCAPRPVASFAAGCFRGFLAGGDALEVRVLVKGEPDVGMATFADRAADKRTLRGGVRRRLGLGLWQCLCPCLSDTAKKYGSHPNKLSQSLSTSKNKEPTTTLTNMIRLVGLSGGHLRTVIFSAILCVFVNVLAAKDRKSDIAAKEAFEELESQPAPQADALYQCAVTQLGVIRNGRSQRALALPRDAYCRFLLSLVAADKDALQKAPDLLRKAQGDGRNHMAPLLEILAILARLQNGTGDVSVLAVAIPRVNCPQVEFVNERTCTYILNAARIWSGHSDLIANRLEPAKKILVAAGDSGWIAWSSGLAFLGEREWRPAAASLSQAAKQWSASAGSSNLTELLSPAHDLPAVLANLGYAQFMDNNLEAALAALDGAIAARPTDANSLYLRARIRETLGLSGPAMSDLEAAAKADPTHFMEGVLLCRQGKNKEAAEAFEKAPDTAPDLAAWKLLAQGCDAPADRLAAAAGTASRLFPQQEASRMALDCRLRAAANLDQLMNLDSALHASYRDRVSQERISNAYLKFGLDAEDHHDIATAVAAYTKAIEWLPLNTKARFNLAAIYVGDQKYELAEPQYRALLEADSSDHESQFWLAQSMLVSRPDAPRKAEACALLRQAVKIEDPARRAQFAAVAATNCGQ
jgi:tetratricopeptide (TPR) repeat protein